MKQKFALQFDERALAEWQGLDPPIQKQFKRKLAKLISGEEQPSPRARIASLGPDYYKIKQRSSGYRLVYRYKDTKLVILVIAVGKRSRNLVYEAAHSRAGKR